MGSGPPRRLLAERRRAPRPAGYDALGKGGWRGLLIESLGRLNRGLRERPAGLWLRERLERERSFAHVDLRLGRGGPGLHGLRIAYASDLHVGGFMTEADLCRIFERLADAEPDLVCLGGDLVDSRPQESLLLGKALSLLRAPLGVYAIPGNHDYYADPDLRIWRHCLEEHGVTLLLNAGLRIERNGEGLWLAGVDDLTRGSPDLAAALHGAHEQEPILLLAHHPDFFHEAASVGVDLTLAGHTHAGQIVPFGRPLTRHTRLGYWRGRYEKDGAQLYVGSGVGTVGIPVRFRAPAELPLIRIRTRD